MTLPEGSSLAATEKEAAHLARYLDTKTGQIKNYSYYVGEGAPRFVLTLEPVLPADNYAQFVVVAADVEGREALAEDIRREIEERQARRALQYQEHPPGAAFGLSYHAARVRL